MTSPLHEPDATKARARPATTLPEIQREALTQASKEMQEHFSVCHVQSSKELHQQSSVDHMYVVENGVLVVDKATLLTSRFGTYLLRHRWMSMVLHLLCLICVLLYFIPFGGTDAFKASDSNGTKVLELASPFQSICGSSLCILAIALNAHQMNRQLFFKCVLSFDFMVIVSSGALIQLVWYCNWYLVFVVSGEWHGWQIPTMILEFVASVCFYIAIATMDCLTMRYTRKVLICSILMASFLAEFIVVRCGWKYNNFFADKTLDWWLISTTPDEIYLSCKLQLLLFLGKATVAYACGQPFCCIKADYLVPGRSVFVGQLRDHIARQISNTLTPSSCRANEASVLSVVAEFGNEGEHTHEGESDTCERKCDEEPGESGDGSQLDDGIIHVISETSFTVI